MPVPRLPRRVGREQLNIAAHNLLRRAARRVNLDLVRADFNSPIVHTGDLAPDAWPQAAATPGLELDLDEQLQFIEQRLAPFIAEFRPPLTKPSDPLAFYLENRWYGPMDAHILYAMLRRAQPAKLVEVGSGYSTLIAAQALAANGANAAHDVIDPYPSRLIQARSSELTVHRQSAATIDPATFTQLGAGDVLFVDSTHVVKPGGEVTRLVLEVLPALAPGVLVHFHDVFRPFEYPRILHERFNVHWQEHYLLQAFLAFNPNFRVICANHALWRLRRERVTPLFAGLREGMQPSAFWFVRAISQRPEPDASP